MDTEDLILELKQYAAPTFFPDSSQVAERWFKDAAGAIQRRRKVTTVKETTITTVEGTYEYDMPADAIQVIQIVGPTGPTGGSGIEAVSNYGEVGFNTGEHVTGVLPNGQVSNMSIQFIRRQSARIDERETVYRVQGGKINFDFEAEDGTDVLVRYRAEDREPSNVPDRYVEALLTYARAKLVSWTIQRHFNNQFTDSESWLQNNLGNYRRQQRELEEEWQVCLASISAEIAA